VRDVDNHPRATFQHWPPDATTPYGWTGTPVGHGDTTPVGLGYARRILEWHASLPYAVVLDNGRWPDEIIFYPERETRAAAGRVRRSVRPLVGVSR
jgi:hypothetical protein